MTNSIKKPINKGIKMFKKLAALLTKKPEPTNIFPATPEEKKPAAKKVVAKKVAPKTSKR